MASARESSDFMWQNWRGGELPVLEPHSKRKLELLRDYLVLYLQIVLANAQGKNLQYVTLVDGFAGGGSYADGEAGSPLVILTAVREAEALINLTRTKPVRIVPVCYFIEEDPEAFACLEAQLQSAGYRNAIGRNIHLRRAKFTDCVPQIVEDITTRHTRGGNRTIFFLDQFGYADIPASMIRRLDQELNGRAEFIINFSIGWLADFMSQATIQNYTSVFENLGLQGHIDVHELLRMRQTLGGSWRHPVEAMIGTAFHAATGIKFFSPFYIEPYDNHRGYWLLHLAQKQRARAAMTTVHWSKMNRSKHYGPHGYEILSYKPDLDPTIYLDGMSFNAETKITCQALLAEDFGRLVRDQFIDGITYQQLADRTCNHTIADSAMLDEALWQLFSSNEVDIASRSGKRKRSRTLSITDIIRPKRQLIFSGFGEIAAAPPRRQP